MKIIIAEDDPDQGRALAEFVRREGHEPLWIATGKAALEALDARSALLLSDLRLPDMSGLDLLRLARERNPLLEILILTAFGTVDTAVEAMRLGARNYLTKPVNPGELQRHLRTLEELIELRSSTTRTGREGMVGASAAMRRVYETLDVAAASNAAVLITGETGTGKEVAARAIHHLSARRRAPFIAVNVGALPGELVESELFGHEKGAFTGAHRKKEGRFALAGGGTLFLDELDALPLPIQPKLLRALETREVWSVGSETPFSADVRLLAATSVEPGRLTDGRVLRTDLYYRLTVFTVHLPPLRERPEDIPLLVRTFLDEESRRIRDRKNAARPAMLDISSEALARLMQRPWPGNVRELKNVIERAVAQLLYQGASSNVIGPEHLGFATPESVPVSFKDGRFQAAEDWARETIRKALSATEGNVSEAARRLKMNTSALFRLIKKYNLKSS